MLKKKSSKSVTPAVAVPLVEPRLITTKEAARQLSISAWEIRNLCRKGLLAYRKLSKTNWLITTASVKAFAEAAVRP